MQQLHEEHALPFDHAVQVLGLLDMRAVEVDVIDPNGVSVMTGRGSVQHVEYATAEKSKVIVHGDGWRFTAARDTDRITFGAGRLSVRRATDVEVRISIRDTITVREEVEAA